MTKLTYAWGTVSVGTVLRHSCTYSAADVDSYDALSGRADPGTGDTGETDGAAGTLPDLLVIAPLTKLGGDLDYLSRQMTWTTHGPVEVGEPIEAELEVTGLEERESAYKIAFTARIRTADGRLVVTGDSKGLILKTPATTA